MATMPPQSVKEEMSFAKVTASQESGTNGANVDKVAATADKQPPRVIDKADRQPTSTQPDIPSTVVVPAAGNAMPGEASGFTNGEADLLLANNVSSTNNPHLPSPLAGGPPNTNNPHLLPTPCVQEQEKGAARDPISEENITKITSAQASTIPSSNDTKSVASATTYTLDEKESLRPDDSASVKAGDDEDGRASTQAGSRIGSDSGARAFSDQLREISRMGPQSRQAPNISRASPAVQAPAGVLYSPSPLAGPTSFPGLNRLETPNEVALSFPPDEKLLAALNSVRDRVWVLKLEQDITDFVKDETAQSYDLPQCNSFYRMLAHKMADYYLLGHIMDSQTVRLWKTPSSRIPPRLSTLTEPATASSTPPPAALQMKILRRGGPEGKSGNGDDANRDNEGDSGSDSGKNKPPATLEERAARYEAARLRILGSAKPSEDPPTVGKEDESRSSSAAGKKKNRKQRSDSEDGFEARSAYNTFSNNPNNAMHDPSQMYSSYPNAGGPAYNQSLQFDQSGQYVPDQQAMMHAAAGPYQWYQQDYSNTPNHTNSQWQQNGYGGGYGMYDMSSHFQQNMSFQQPSSPMHYSPHPAVQSNGNMPTGSGHWQPQMGPQSPSQAFGSQYNNIPSQMNGQPYAYGVLPGQSFGGKRQNPNHPLPGSFNRQQSFNPQSQTFTPGYSSQQMMPAGYPAPYNQSQQPYQLQRQGSTQSQLSSHGQAYGGQTYNGHANNGSPGGSLPSAQGLTHPLPQPVFSQAMSHGTRQTNQQQAPSGLYPQNKYGSAQNTPNATKSTLAKFVGASLPAKPPPVDASYQMSMGMSGPSRSPGYGATPLHGVPGRT